MQRRDVFPLVLMISLACGAVAFICVIVMESIVLPNMPPPAKPYGAPAALSVVYCAALGATGTILCLTKNQNMRISAFTVALLIATQLLVGLSLNFATWDAGDFFIYPLPLTIFAVNMILVTYLGWRRIAPKRQRECHPSS